MEMEKVDKDTHSTEIGTRAGCHDVQLLCSIQVIKSRGRVENTYASFSLTTRTRTSSYVILRHPSCFDVMVGDGRTSSLLSRFAKYFFPPFSQPQFNPCKRVDAMTPSRSISRSLDRGLCSTELGWSKAPMGLLSCGSVRLISHAWGG
jgi:hypothetical protein